MPLIISWPGRFQKGKVCNSVTQLVDLYPTLLELQRPADAPKLTGRSLVPVLTKGKPTGRAYAISENWSQVTVITDRYKLGTWIDPTARHAQRDFRKRFPDMLFDRETDPQELVNLAGNPEAAGIEKQLRAYLAEWTSKTPEDGKKEMAARPASEERGTNKRSKKGSK